MQSSIYHSSLFQPLRQPRFRQLWFANLLSNVGSWAHAFAATWQVSALSQSAITTLLVQAATWAPMLFFLMGAGAAFALPAWQASMSELVAKEDIAAVASLNSLNYSAATLAGPFLGGLLLQQYGPTPLCIFNAVSFCGLLWLYKQWQPLNTTKGPIGQSQTNALLAGIAASWKAVRYRTLLLHSVFIFCLSIAFQALLPSLVRRTSADAGDFGVLMGALGVGAVLASTFLPRLRRHVRHRSVLDGALVVYAAMLGLVGLTQSMSAQGLLIVCGGMAWSTIVSTVKRAALIAFPAALRARTLSIYIFMSALGQTIGGALWGQLAHRLGTVPILLCTAGAMVACAVSLFFSADFLGNE